MPWILVVIWLASLLVSIMFFLQSRCFLFWSERSLEISEIQPARDYGPSAYTIRIGTTWMNQTSAFRSPAKVLENGKPLAYPNSARADIGATGRGRFSLWNRWLSFSTSDNTDPRKNGRKYTLYWPTPISKMWLWGVYFLATLTTGILGTWFLLLTKRGAGVLNSCRARLPHRLALAGILLCAAAILAPGFGRALPILLAGAFARLETYSRVVDLKDYEIKAEEGYYSFDVSRLGLRSISDSADHPERSPVVLQENGVPLRPHADLQDLKAGKAGVFRHWWHRPSLMKANQDMCNRQDRILFSPLSGNPASNRYLLVVPGTPADAFTISQSWPLKVILFFMQLFAITIGLLAAWLICRNIGTASHLWYQLPLILALIISYYLSTALGVMDGPPCQPESAYSTWDVVAVSPDSASYYFGYAPGSVRNPGYTWFINLFAGRFDPNAVANITPIGACIADVTHPFLKVSRAQIVILLGAGVLLCFTMMVILRSPLPAVLFLFFYELHFFIWMELNNVLTESLTQAWLILVVSCFLLFLWKEKPFLLPLAGILVAGSYLTRQVSGYTLIFPAAMIAWGLIRKWREYWKPSLICIILFFLFSALPDAHAYLKIGKTTQENLAYQYKIVFALRVAKPEDVKFMPDEESRKWLAESLVRRDRKDREFDAKWGKTNYYKNIFRVESAYEVALTQKTENHDPSFYLKVSKEILKRRWLDHFRFGWDALTATLSDSYINRLGFTNIGFFRTWLAYLLAIVSIAWIRGRSGYAGAVLIVAHWSHVMLCCLFAAPLPRMVWATDGLVLIALSILGIEIFHRGLERRKMENDRGLPGTTTSEKGEHSR